MCCAGQVRHCARHAALPLASSEHCHAGMIIFLLLLLADVPLEVCSLLVDQAPSSNTHAGVHT